jgi:hypothetical protein
MNTSLSARPRWRRDDAPTAGESTRQGIRLALAATAAAGLAVATMGAAGAAAAPNASTGHGTAAVTSSWKIVKSVRGNSPDFTAVAVTGRHGAWAFESTSSGNTTLPPTAWRLADGQWARASFPGKQGERVLSASATSPSDVWALANTLHGARALLFNGTTWSVMKTFHNRIFGSVVALSRHEAWAFGHTPSPGAWHFHTNQWSMVKSGHGLFAGSALAPGNVWAIGPTSVAHWNGAAWSRTSVKALLPPDTKFSHSRLTSIYAQSRSSVWAVGTQGQESQGGPVVILHYDGHHWARAALASVCCGGPGQVIPDGSGGLWVPYGLMGFGYSMLHYTGGHVHKVALPAPRGTNLQLASAAAVPGERRAFAVGAAQRPHVGGSYTRALILAFGS